jgi:hypothetical protein
VKWPPSPSRGQRRQISPPDGEEHDDERATGARAGAAYASGHPGPAVIGARVSFLNIDGDAVGPSDLKGPGPGLACISMQRHLSRSEASRSRETTSSCSLGMHTRCWTLGIGERPYSSTACARGRSIAEDPRFWCTSS